METLTNKNKAKPKTTNVEGSELFIGNKERKVNKCLFKERNSTVNKIGKLVSVRLDIGQTTTRKATNLLKL